MKTIKRLHSGHIEIAVVALMNYRVHTIVPNVSHGLFLNHECDLLMLDGNGRFTEIEIKISASDLKADFKKRHSHQSDFISRLIYAMPKPLCEKYHELIPKHCGIISVDVDFPEWMNGVARVKASHFRYAKHDKTKRLPTEREKKNFMRLGCMRIWSLKVHNNKTLIKSEPCQ